MKDTCVVDDVKVKKANISHHNNEAEIYQTMHPELFSLYERSQALKNINYIHDNSTTDELCLDVGCGTGFTTSIELPLYKNVVATDISRRMLEVVRKKLGHFASLNLLICDAEFSPFRSGIADLVSVSAVLHHLPKPFNSATEALRIIKNGGFLYVTREPNLQRLRRFSASFDHVFVHKLARLVRHLPFLTSRQSESKVVVDELDYSEVDVHLSGFYIPQFAEYLRSRYFEVVRAYSYYWIFPDSDTGLFQKLLTKSNFFIEKIPLAKEFGRYINIIARKLEGNFQKVKI